MYYILAKKPLGDPEDLAVIDEYPEVEGIDTWLLGTPFTVEVPEPLEFILDDSFPGRLPDFFSSGMPPLMSDRLLEALREIGVDNLDTYRAVLKNLNGEVVSESYKAVNVIGVVSVADVGRSQAAPGQSVRMIDTSFDSLAIDEEKAAGHLLFRLAEAVTAVVIHEKVKEHLEARGLGALGFIRPEEWMS